MKIIQAFYIEKTLLLLPLFATHGTDFLLMAKGNELPRSRSARYQNTENLSNKSVIPHLMRNPEIQEYWIPAFAGMTMLYNIDYNPDAEHRRIC